MEMTAGVVTIIFNMFENVVNVVHLIHIAHNADEDAEGCLTQLTLFQSRLTR